MVKRDYGFKSRMRKNRVRKRRPKFFYLWAVFILIIIVYVSLFTEILEAVELDITGNDSVSTEDILNQVKDVVVPKWKSYSTGRTNMAFANKQRIKSNIMENIPKIGDVDVRVDFFGRKIKIAVKEREPYLIWCKVFLREVIKGENKEEGAIEITLDGDENIMENESSEKGNSKELETEVVEEITGCFFGDREGVIYDRSPFTGGSLYLLVKDASKKEISPGYKIDAGFMNKLAVIKDDISAVGIDINSFMVRAERSPSIEILTQDGWKLFLDMDEDIEKQARIVFKVLKDEIKGNTANLEYIDLRVKNKVYYK